MALAETTSPTPPPLPRPLSPGPWMWKCHNCRAWHRLSCTRRCLNCSHTFCQQPDELLQKSTTRPTKRRKTKGGPCHSEFEYTGWAAWGSWRRAVLKDRDLDQAIDQGKQPQPQLHDMFQTYLPRKRLRGENRVITWDRVSTKTQEEVKERKEEMYVKQEHDCWVHCDYPSECRHARIEALGKRKRAEEEEEWKECDSPDSPVEGTCWDPATPDPFDITTRTMSEEDEEDEKDYDYASVYAEGSEGKETGSAGLGLFTIYEDETANPDAGSREDYSFEQTRQNGDDEKEKEEQPDEWDDWWSKDTPDAQSSSQSSSSIAAESTESDTSHDCSDCESHPLDMADAEGVKAVEEVEEIEDVEAIEEREIEAFRKIKNDFMKGDLKFL